MAAGTQEKGELFVHVSMAVDTGFELPLLAAVTSLADTHEPRQCRVSILYRGLRPAFRKSLSDELNGRLDIDWIEIPARLVDGAHFPDFVSSATLFRLLLPELLPAHVTRTIYVDADTILTSSFAELWTLDIGESLVAAVRDANNPWAAGPLGTDWEGLGLAPDQPYFNAGCLVIQLDKWREHSVGARAMDLLRRAKLRWGDQDALNVVLAGAWHELSRRWNLQTADVRKYSAAWALWRDDVERAVASPALIHYTERDKPWMVGSTHPLRSNWYDTLDRTSMKGWRPGGSSRHVYSRVCRRMFRAASVLITGS